VFVLGGRDADDAGIKSIRVIVFVL
jgi:hypothetical protein